jgi:selenium metabolism protein YedF
MAKSIDARGLSCPQPVVLTKKAIEEGETALEVLVDNEAASENVTRLGEKLGYQVTTDSSGSEFRVLLTKQAESTEGRDRTVPSTVIFIDSDTVGRGNDELGTVLIKSFFYTLTEAPNKPKKIVFMNSGVKLAVEGSPVLDSLERLRSLGTELLLCGTCLDFFQLKDKVAIGNISNMYDILESFMEADKVVTV